MRRDAGTHFDPRCVDAFLAVVERWEAGFADDRTRYSESRYAG